MRLEPWHFLILIAIALLLFGAPKLPGLARSLGQSMRIFKSEVKQMKDDGNSDPKSSESDGSPVEGRVVDGSHADSYNPPSGNPGHNDRSHTKSPNDSP
ncbi:Sec-independent protein translocase subunit TatA [Arthrobacter roseus]|uniref:Sec-independent protein translocase subunit TatA n=1 Tax=Arthrobacter roseus TaxID=136274 RepID=UPI001963D2B9|nr:Sec-independent protein translocase subunit TatA [Arthrobacter roseus]MBM7848562.1 sec-independent protein translocase protein TatA [Arthrobacter roseus]